jgi:hypothetical protein
LEPGEGVDRGFFSIENHRALRSLSSLVLKDYPKFPPGKILIPWALEIMGADPGLTGIFHPDPLGIRQVPNQLRIVVDQV